MKARSKQSKQTLAKANGIRRVPINGAQYQMLLQAQVQVQQAQDRFGHIASAILAGHALRGQYRIVSIESNALVLAGVS